MARADRRLLGAAAAALMEVAAEASPAEVYRPSEVLPDVRGAVIVDTEGSGLHPDDGARPSIVIVAWRELDRTTSYAFPFDQGSVVGKPGVVTRQFDTRQGDLFDSAGEMSEAGVGADGRGSNLPVEEWRWLTSWLCSRELVVFHNAKHDLHQLRVGHREWGEGVDLVEAGIPIYDTMGAAREMDPTESVALDAVARRLGVTNQRGEGKAASADAVKTWLARRGLDKGRYDLVPWDIIAPYAISDGDLTVGVYYEQQAEIARRLAPRTEQETAKDFELRRRGLADWVIPREFEVTRALYSMEKRGLPFDSVGCTQAAGELEAALERIVAQLPFDPSKPSSVKRYYFGTREAGGLGLVPYAVTAARSDPKLDEDVRRRMIRDGVPHADLWDEYERIDTALTMWYRAYPNMAGPDGRLRTSFKQFHVRSGRFSVERFQAQALPHDHKMEASKFLGTVPSIRKLVEQGVPDGFELWEVDLAQAELRVAAITTNCRRMLDLIYSGEDLHGATARDLWHTDESDHDWFKYRQVAKRGNFSLIFGVGPDTFRETVRKLLGIEMERLEVESMVQKWNGLYPQYRRQIWDLKQLMEDRQEQFGHAWVQLVNGRRSWFQTYEDKRPAFNRYVQASLAELNKDWLVWTEQNHPGVTVLSVHDSQYLLVPAGEGEGIANDIAAAGGRIGTRMFRVKMECSVSKWNQH